MKSEYSSFESVAIVEDLEHVFAIKISDAEAAEVATVQDAINLVKKHKSPDRQGYCLARQVFFQLRTRLELLIGVNKANLKLHTQIWQFVSGKFWPSNKELLLAEFPRTSLQIAISGRGCLVALVSALVPIFPASILILYFKFPVWGVIVAAIIGLSIGLLFLKHLPAAYNQLPVHVTFRELIAQTVAERITIGADFTEKDLELVVKGILALHLGKNLESILNYHHLVKDLDLME